MSRIFHRKREARVALESLRREMERIRAVQPGGVGGVAWAAFLRAEGMFWRACCRGYGCTAEYVVLVSVREQLERKVS